MTSLKKVKNNYNPNFRANQTEYIQRLIGAKDYHDNNSTSDSIQEGFGGTSYGDDHSNYYTLTTGRFADEISSILLSQENLDVVRETLAARISERYGLEMDPYKQDERGVSAMLNRQYKKFMRHCDNYDERLTSSIQRVAIINWRTIVQLERIAYAQTKQHIRYKSWHGNALAHASQPLPTYVVETNKTKDLNSLLTGAPNRDRTLDDNAEKADYQRRKNKYYSKNAKELQNWRTK